MPDMLLYNETPFAVPAFRIIALLDGEISDEANRGALAQAYQHFEEAWGAAAYMASYRFGKHRGKIRKLNTGLVAQGRAFFEQAATEYGDGLRRYGYVLSEFEDPALPYFGVEQRSGMAFFEIDLPAEHAHNVAFANLITDLLLGAKLICGVMGMGFFLPPHKSSLEFELAQQLDRYPAAIHISPAMVMDGVRRENSMHRWAADEQPGIADIGWRTLIGWPFFGRVTHGLAALEREVGVSTRCGNKAIAVTAGAEPVWGDASKHESISAYRAVARHLAPIRFPRGCARCFMFGGNANDDARAAERLDAYLGRFG
ncbi:type VI immunity family protein [Bordetella genomosp. 13]|uniref:type VI immunity family protein n=1 Tax=Bordetella genomosp. 13 TaxID=463040 RepID=UPI0011A0CDFB|nr:type VI immunity family protein [Bordetella genomosp. 13]